MADDRPTLWLIAGPNGAGKTTYAFRHIRQVSGSVRFVNLDEIARGISPLEPGAGRIEAARIALSQISSWLAEPKGGTNLDLRKSFSIETTLSGLTHLRTIEAAQRAGWRVMLLYFAVPDAETALHRIARRVSEGGHDVPEADVRRRFVRSIGNFRLYVARVDGWRVFDNRKLGSPIVIAEGRAGCRISRPEPEGLPAALLQNIQILPECPET
jgi:predicted ABC-type ATPase